jgi:hypothetical protein
VASAFISYAHEDQEFVLTLVERLQDQGLDIRYDQVVLNIGDSLIRTISREIVEGDFVVGIVSPDSLASEWCQTELALAMNQGIDERRVKVLPVKYRGAVMPPMLRGTYWADADEFDVETVARKLAAAIRANLEGRGEDATHDAEEAENAGGDPAHIEAVGDAAVAQIEEVAQRAMDVIDAWDGIFRRGGNVQDVVETQRRLRWALDVLPDRLAGALPLVEQMANSDWDGFFADRESENVEREMRDELLAVRTRIAQGLPVVGRWLVVADGGVVDAGNRDAVAHLWAIRRGEETRRITVYISGTAIASADAGLPQEVVAAKDTQGRSVMSMLVALDDPPRQVMVTTAGVSLTMPD